MKTLYLILIFCIFAFTSIQAQDTKYDDFTILFYKYPNFKEEAGVISGSVAVNGHGGAPEGNMSVGSLKANSFLQVTIYSEKFYKGESKTYTGSKKKIIPAFHVGSVKWKHL